MQFNAAVLLALLMAVVVAPGPPVDDAVEIYKLSLRAAARSGATPQRRMPVAAATVVNAEMWENFSGVAGIHPRERATYASRETIEAYLAASARAAVVPTPLERGTEFALFPLKALEEAWESGNPAPFLRRHRLVRGFAQVSQIGFNGDRSEALLYVSYVCGGLCGSGHLVYLERRGQTWQVVKVDQVHMS